MIYAAHFPLSDHRPKHRPGEYGAAIAVALLVHGALFWSLVYSQADPILGVDGARGIAVALLGTSQTTQSAASPSPSQSLFDELQKSEDGYMPAPAKRSPRQSLSDLFGDGDAPEPSMAQAAGGQGVTTARSGLVGDPGAQISGGRRTVVLDKNGQIAPCWRLSEHPVPVKIMIILDHQGGMIGPPTINRPRNARLDAARQAAETMALRAMAGCAPYTLASVGGRYRSFELDFSKDRNWVSQAGMVDVY